MVVLVEEAMKQHSMGGMGPLCLAEQLVSSWVMVEEYGRCSDQADSIATVELSVVAIDQRNRISSRCYRTRIRYAPAWLLFEMWWCLVVVPKLGRFQNPERDGKKQRRGSRARRQVGL